MKTSNALALLFVAAIVALGGCESYVLERPPQRQLTLDEANIARDDIVVLINSRAGERSLVKVLRQLGYRVTRRERLAGLGLFLFSVEPPTGVSRAQAIQEIERIDPSATAGVNHRYDIQSSTDKYVVQAFISGQSEGAAGFKPRDYAADLIGWPRAGCRAAAKIGVIDSPLSKNRAASSKAALIEEDFTQRLSTAAPSEPTHGDLIAELLVGAGRVAVDKLFVAAVVDAEHARPGAGVFEFVQAIDWLQSSDVRVVNVSLTGPYNKILDRAVQRAVSKGMIIVAAAGNDGPAAAPRYPAAFDGVIAVTAVDHAKKVFKHAARGAHIDLAAPGVDVFVPVGKNGRYVSGTSIAAPFVAARIAVDPTVLARRTVKGVRAALAADAQDIGPTGTDDIFGAGLVSAPADCRN